MNKAVYLKHIKVIKEEPMKLIGKTIKDVFYVDKNSFFFKDQNEKIYYYTTFLSDKNVLPGLKLETQTGFDKEKQEYFLKGQRLYLYPDVYDKNIFEGWVEMAGRKDDGDKRYEWTKKAFEFGIFNDHIKKEYLKKLDEEYEEYGKNQIKHAKELLAEAKKQYERL